jgi:hypothetical protein
VFLVVVQGNPASDGAITIGSLATILTVAGVTIYVLGLIGLAIPIRREFTQDLSTAWYAVALIPKTVVAGQGVRIWLRWPFVFTAILFIATILIKPYPIIADLLLLVPVFIATYFLWTRVQRLSARTIILVNVAVVAGSGTIIFGIISFTQWLFFRNAVLLPSFLSSTGHSITSILLTLLGTFLLGIGPAITEAPPLPEVKVTKRSGGEEGPEPPKRHLVAHSDGFWHFFDENNDLLSIPDDQVSYVRVVRKTDTPPAKEPMHVRLLRFLRGKAK